MLMLVFIEIILTIIKIATQILKLYIRQNTSNIFLTLKENHQFISKSLQLLRTYSIAEFMSSEVCILPF